MDGRKDNPESLISQRRSRFVAGRIRRIERKLAQEPLARRERGGNALERLEIAHPDARVVVAGLHQRAQPCDSVGDFGASATSASQRRQAGIEVGEPEAVPRHRDGKAIVREAIVRSLRGDDGLGDLRPDARHELRDAKAGDPISRIFGKAHERNSVFDMRRVEEL